MPLFHPTKLARSLSVEPGEEQRTALLFVLLFLASMIFVMGRTARDALFLTHFPVTWIAYMWVAYGIVSSIAAAVFGWVSARFSRTGLAISFALLASVSYVVIGVVIGAGVSWAIVFFYVWADVVASLFVIQAWTITNDLHDPRSARRLFGLIGAGNIVGMLISGFVTGWLVRSIGTLNLIFVIAGIMVGYAALVHFLGQRHQLPKAAQSTKDRGQDKSSLRPHRRYLLLTSIMLGTAFIALTLGDYQFKAIAKLNYPGLDDLASYMAAFYAVMGVIAFVFQVFITPRILKHLGVASALLVMPIAFLSSTAALLFSPVLPVVTILKLSDNGLQYTIHDATMQLLYFAFPTSVRTRVRAILDATVKPLGCSLGGVLLALLSPVPIQGESAASLAPRIAQVGLVSLVLGILWMGIIPFVRKAYVESLRKSLVRRQSDLDEELDLRLDAATENVLIETLSSGAPAQVVFALERLLVSAPEVARKHLPNLVAHESATVRAFAVEQMALLDPDGAANLARAQIADPNVDVRCAAITTLGSIRQENAVDEIEYFAYDDAHPKLRNCTIVTLITHGGLPGVLAGGSRLQQMIQSTREDLRIEAATILGQVGQPGLARSLEPLLRDTSAPVRRAAATAARGCAHLNLVAPLLDAMSERSLIKPLALALIAIGPDSIPELARRLRDEDTPRLVRLSIPRVLHGMGSEQALEVLRSCFATVDEGVRQKCLASASRLREDLQAPALPTSALDPLIDREITEHVQTRDGYLRIRPWLARPLLDKQLHLELRGHIVRIMRLCEQAYPRTHVAAARAGIFSKDPLKRANALEVLDNVLDRENRLAILSIVDRFASDCQFPIPIAKTSGSLPAKQKAWFTQRLELPGHYRRSVLLEAVAFHRVHELADCAFPFLQREDPFMRENALMVLAACRPEGWQRHVQRAVDDDDPVVRSFAQFVLQKGWPGQKARAEMYTTVEKILYLQGVPLFSGVNGNDLMPLAIRSQVLRLAPGEELFKEGDPGDCLFVIFHGQVVLRKDARELAVLGEGDVVGELAILDEAPRMVSAMAQGEVDVLRVSSEDFRGALQDTEEFANGVITVLAKRLRDLMGPTARWTEHFEGEKSE